MHDAIHIYLLCSCDACWRSQHICLYHFVFRHVPEMWPSTLKAFSLANIWRCFPHVYTQSSGPCRHFGRDKISFFACGWPPMSSGTNEFDVTNEFGENTHGRCLFFFYIYIYIYDSFFSFFLNIFLAHNSGVWSFVRQRFCIFTKF